jgi:hypothetical protein
MTNARARMSAEIPALGPSYASHRRSSNANSLCGRHSAGSPEICATFQYEAVNFQNFFLRHQDFRLKLQERPGDGDPAQSQFDLDATFLIVDGLAPHDSSREIHSLRAVNFDTMFLRHRDFHLFLTEINTDLDRMDATFEIIDGFVDGGSS